MLTAFLVFAGIGSGVSQRIAERIEAWNARRRGHRPDLSPIELAVAGITGVSVLYIFILPRLFESLVDRADATRILVSLGLIAPLAFFMGMPFPLGLSRLWSNSPALVPWAWGVNGCASVMSVLLATLIAMNSGFSMVVVAAVLLYAGAAAVFRRPVSAAEVGPLRRRDQQLGE